MKIIAGLGNPGIKYTNTRHNLGFMTMDVLAARLAVSFEQKKHHSLSVSVPYKGEKLLLLKPQTFMNESGMALHDALNYYKTEADSLLVIYDDMDLLPFEMRLRRTGSAGGHKGMTSVIRHLGTENICRVKIGIGHPVYNDVVDYVLQSFTKEELPGLAKAITVAAEAALCWAEEGITAAMNKYNGL